MQLLDVPARKWSREVCDALNISEDLLATVYESPDITGHITQNAAEETGLPVGIPVAGGAGDNAASAIGTGVCNEGDAFTTIGTSGVVFAPISAPTIDPKGRVHTFCAAVPGTWHIMGVTQAAGLSLNWFRKQFASDLSYAQIDALCEQLPIGAEKLLYLPYLMGERTPILDPNARGVFFGLSAMHTRAHLARAVMEGVSYSLRDCLEILEEMKIKISRMTLCGGGAKSPLWRQMLSDVYGMPVGILPSNEGAVLGAAILGGCAAGIYSSVEQGCQSCIRPGKTILPSKQNHADYLRYYEVYRRLYPGLRDAFFNMQSLSEDNKGEGL